MSHDWKAVAKMALENGWVQATIPRHATEQATESAVFVEAMVELPRCLVCGDAITPCPACSISCCTNGQCQDAKHNCPATKEE